MSSIQERIAELVQRCHDQSRDTGRPTRAVAQGLVKGVDDDLVRRMAAEFLVNVLAREERASALSVERSATRPESTAETAGSSLPRQSPLRRGTKAWQAWAQTDEGRAHLRREQEEDFRSDQLMYGAIRKALDRYTEDLRIDWTADLLASTFSLGDGTTVTWAEATVEQHEQRRQMFLNNAHANLEGAARHEVAIRELRAAGVAALGELANEAA